MDYLRANELQVTETVRGQTYANKERQARYDELARLGPDGRTQAQDQEFEQIGHRLMYDQEYEKAAKYAAHVLPGGTGYRELLITLPIESRAVTTRRAEIADRLDTLLASEPLTPAQRDESRRLAHELEQPREPFRGGHFEEPNVLVHLRFDDRTDAEGKKVLFIEEIQSDWMQSGRKKGFGKVEANTGEHAESRPWKVGATLYASRENAESAARSLVPDAPFKTTWQELALKRAVRYAAEHGYDSLAWTTGEQQAERYDLSKQVHSITWEQMGSDAPNYLLGDRRSVHIDFIGDPIVAFNIDDKGTVTRIIAGGSDASTLKGKQLDDVVGKDMATKIIGDPSGSLKGEGLKVGGSGMKGFYDAILPAYLNKWAKPFGGRVGTTKIEASKAERGPLRTEPVTVHALPLTPEMRQTALAGLPLFSRERFSVKGLLRSAKEQWALLDSTYQQIQMVSMGGRQVAVIDAGSRMNQSEIERITRDKAMQHATVTILKVLDDIMGKVVGAEAVKIERTGLIFDDRSYGVFMPKPGTHGETKRAAILLNPFEHMIGTKGQVPVADAVERTYITAVHEALHWKIGVDGPHFEAELVQLLNTLGQPFAFESTARIMEAYADPTRPGQYRRGLLDLLPLYQASRGRKPTAPDALSTAASRAERPADQPDRARPPPGDVRRSGSKVVTRDELTRLAKKRGTSLEIELARAAKAGYTVATPPTAGGTASTGLFTNPAPTSAADVQPVAFPELVALAKELASTPQVVKAFRTEGTLGQFRGDKPIRIRAELFKKGNERQLVATLAHEIGHLVDWLPHQTLKRGNLLGRLFSLRSFLKQTFIASDGSHIKNKDIRAELTALSNAWRPWDEATASKSFAAYRKSAKELFADAISVLLNDPARLEREAPVFFEQFFNELDRKPDVKVAYQDMQELLSGTPAELIAKRRERVRAAEALGGVTALDAHRAKIAQREAEKRSYWFLLKTAYYDKNTPIRDLVAAAKRRGVVIPEDEDPRYFLRERNYVGGKMKAAADEHVQPIRQALQEAAIPWVTFHESLMYDRIIDGDRSEYANPEGLAPAEATDLSIALGNELSTAQRAVLQRAKDDLRDWMQTVSREAYRVGLLSDAVMKQIEENDAYVPFRVVEHIEDTVSWQVYQQRGTLKSIGNTADAAVLKTMATIRAIERQKMLTQVFAFMEQHAPEAIAQAEERWNGKAQAPVEPKPSTHTAMVSYYDHGKRRGKIVDAFVANSLTNYSVGQNMVAVKALTFVNSHWFRPVFTTFNLAFQTKNFARDLQRSWANRPDTTFGEIVKSPLAMAKFYAKGIPLARARAFGPTLKTRGGRQAATDLREAEKAAILGVTWNDLMRGRDVADTEIDQILGKLGIGPATPPTFVHGPLATPKAGVALVLRFIEEVGNFIETLPKAAGIYEYKGQGTIADISPAQRAYIREKMGSPDFLIAGTDTPISNNLLLFSNAFIQGTAADIAVMTGGGGPGGRGPGGKGYGPSVGPEGPDPNFGFWWKTAMLNIAPKLAMFAALYLVATDADEQDGWLTDMRRRLRTISEYDMTNYLVIPMGVDAEGNSVQFRLQQSDTGRLIGGLTWKALQFARGDKAAMASVSQVFEYMAGQTPGVMPMFSLASDVVQFASGGKVYDPFRDRFLFTEDEVRDTRTKRKVGKFLGYEFQQLGGGTVWKFYPGEQRPRAQTGLQTILEWPVVSSIVGGGAKVSNYGEIEHLRETAERVHATEATTRLDERTAVNAALRAYAALPVGQQTTARQEQFARELVGRLYGSESEAVKKAQFADIRTKMRMGAVRGTADALTEAVMSAGSNAQKVAIVLDGLKAKSRRDGDMWLNLAVRERVVSAAVKAQVDANR